jgi:tetratricopeptide (TPR) repeat protein
MNREYHFRVKGDAEQIRKALDLLDGEIQTMVPNEEQIEITWKPNTDADPLQKVADILREGNYADGIALLELFLSDDPTDTTVLFNLGLAYSDQGEWDRSIELLRKLIEKEAQHTNGLVALGVALLRANKTEEGIHELQRALSQEPDNVWARHNMGVGLTQMQRYADALEHLRHAVELKADDAAAWFDYGQAFELNGDSREANKAYRKVIDLDTSGEIAERARAAMTEK